jgi:hypothetical protein
MASSVGIYLEPHTNNIGIGTTSPQAKQHVSGDVLVTHSGTGAALIVNQQGAGKIFEVQDAGTACVTVLDGGNVGIGTTIPLQKLHVIGNTRIQGDAVITGNWSVQGTTTYIDTYTAVTSNVTINNVSGNGPALRVTQSGVGANYPIADFYDNDVSTTVPALRIADGGNVGIGVTNPTSKLEIDGAIKSRNNGFYGLNGRCGKFYISMSRNLFVPSSQFEILNIPLPSTQENSEVVSFELVCNYVVNSTRTADIEHFTTITGELKLLLSISNDYGLIISRFTDYQKIIEIQGPSSSVKFFINYDPITITNQTTNSGALQLYMIASTTYTRNQILEIDGKITHVGTNKSLNLANITFEPSNAYSGGTTIQATTGVVDSGTQFLGQAADSVNAPSYSWTGDSNVGLYRPATDTLGVVTNGAERMRVDASGNVGIGTTQPQAKLDINGNITVSGSISAGNMGMFRNKVINGDFQVQQRGTTFAYPTNLTYCHDRWHVSYYGALNVYFTIYTGGIADSPPSGYLNFARIQQTITTSYINVYYIQSFESRDIIPLRGNTMSISCNFRQSSGWTANVAIQVFSNTATDAKYDPSFGPAGNTNLLVKNLPANGVWNYVTATFTLPSNASGLTIMFVSTNQPANSISNFFDITGVQLEKGPIATPFEVRPYSVELQMCQRYYEIITGYSAIHQAAGLYDSTITFKVNKRKDDNNITLVSGGASTWRAGGGELLSCSIIGNYITSVVVRTSNAIVGGSLGGDVYIDSELKI